MIFVDNQAVTDPCINLAIEEHLLRRQDLAESVLLFYINEPSVIIGRNQNVFEEIDPRYVRAQGIHVVRRMSGGGAVYHDLGNLNFSTIVTGKEDLHNFAKFTNPIVRVLADLGLKTERRQRSSLFAQGKKISGNAQYATGNRLLSHGTLLFESDIEALVRALNPRRIKIESKAVQSVRNRVGNIRDLLPQDLTIGQLRQALLEGMLGQQEMTVRRLDDREWQQIHQLADDRYRQWDWNFGRSPRFTLERGIQTTRGQLNATLVVSKGYIELVRLAGDAWPVGLEEKLIGVRYDLDALAERLADIVPPPEAGSHAGTLSQADLLDLLY